MPNKNCVSFFSFMTSLSNDVSWMPQKVSVFVSWRYFICNSVCAAAIVHASRTRCLLGLGQGSEVYSWKLHKRLGAVLKKPGPEQSPGRSSLQNRCMAHNCVCIQDSKCMVDSWAKDPAAPLKHTQVQQRMRGWY